jgi:mono/diheme cytochrome c family protein
MRLAVSTALAVALFAIGASASPPPLTEADANAAKKIYIAKCAKCHKFYDPGAYSDTNWSVWMAKMTRKARLKDAQSRLLSRYLDEIRATSSSNTNRPAPPR